MRSRLRRLQKAVRGRLSYIELADGSRYWFEPQKAYVELFRYWSASMRAIYHEEARPEPPDVLKAVANARDRRAALAAIYPPPPVDWRAWCPVDVGALVEDGELVPRPLVAGKTEDLSEQR